MQLTVSFHLLLQWEFCNLLTGLDLTKPLHYLNLQ